MKKALFLDRDGIINIDHGYVYQKEKFEFTQGIFELLRLFRHKGYLLFIVTNQSGIGRGYYTQEDFEQLTQWMLERLGTEGIEVEAVHYCPHAPEAKCRCRKPQTGMIDAILQHYPIDLQHSWLIGDKQSDIDLAKHAKIAHSIGIGTHDFKGATLHFESIVKCLEVLRKKPL